MNKFFKDSRDFSVDARKWKTIAMTLKERLDKRNAKVDRDIKRVDSMETALKKVMMENVSTKA